MKIRQHRLSKTDQTQHFTESIETFVAKISY